MNFDYEIMTRPGRNNSNADAFSRLPRLGEPGGSIDDYIGQGLSRLRTIPGRLYADIYMFLEATIVRVKLSRNAVGCGLEPRDVWSRLTSSSIEILMGV